MFRLPLQRFAVRQQYHAFTFGINTTTISTMNALPLLASFDSWLPQSPVSPLQVRHISATTVSYMPLDEFRDSISRQQRRSELVGRSWSAKELRRKSFDDLHKLWLVLYKERNMLLTEQQLSRRKQIIFPQPERLQKVGKSMGAIRQVLGERKRERIALHFANQKEQAQIDNDNSGSSTSSDPDKDETEDQSRMDISKS